MHASWSDSVATLRGEPLVFALKSFFEIIGVMFYLLSTWASALHLWGMLSSFELSWAYSCFACTHHMRWFSFVCLLRDLYPVRGGFHLLAIAVSMLLAISCDVYHGRFKLLGVGAIGLSLLFTHSSYSPFFVWAPPRELIA